MRRLFFWWLSPFSRQISVFLCYALFAFVLFMLPLYLCVCLDDTCVREFMLLASHHLCLFTQACICPLLSLRLYPSVAPTFCSRFAIIQTCRIWNTDGFNNNDHSYHDGVCNTYHHFLRFPELTLVPRFAFGGPLNSRSKWLFEVFFDVLLRLGFDDSTTPILAGRDAFFAERMAAVMALPSPNSLSSSIAIFRLLALRVVECWSSFSRSMNLQISWKIPFACLLQPLGVALA